MNSDSAYMVIPNDINNGDGADSNKDAGDEEEECRDDAVNNTDDNLVRAHRLEHC